MKLHTTGLNSPGERIKYIREELLKVSRAYLHEKYGLSVDTLAAWENGKIQLTEKAIDRCIKIYAGEGLIISREWILLGEGLSPKFSLDLNRYFKSLPTQKPEEKIDDQFLLASEIDYFQSLASNSVTAIITSEDMLPLYAPGDHVGGRYRYDEEIDNCIGKDCIIRTKDDAIYIRRIVKNPQRQGYNLVCLNPQWSGNPEPVIFGVTIECAAPIIWHRKLDLD